MAPTTTRLARAAASGRHRPGTEPAAHARGSAAAVLVRPRRRLDPPCRRRPWSAARPTDGRHGLPARRLAGVARPGAGPRPRPGARPPPPGDRALPPRRTPPPSARRHVRGGPQRLPPGRPPAPGHPAEALHRRHRPAGPPHASGPACPRPTPPARATWSAGPPHAASASRGPGSPSSPSSSSSGRAVWARPSGWSARRRPGAPRRSSQVI